MDIIKSTTVSVDAKDVVLSQSKVKTWESLECKVRAKAEIFGEVQRTPNEYMINGLYFESGCLGASAHGEASTDLPRLKSGEKSADHKRIDLQIDRFKELFTPDSYDFLGWEITDRQLIVRGEEGEGTIDFMARRDGVPSLWDLKLTSDLTSSPGWGNLEGIDFLQQGIYKYWYRKEYGIDPDTFLIIFDYTTHRRIKLLKVDISEAMIAQYLERFSQVNADIRETYEPVPSLNNCARCLVECPKRTIKPLVDYQELSI
jgi:hypothetical protein